MRRRRARRGWRTRQLAVHVMLMEVDGGDPWGDAQRYHRAGELLGIDPADFTFIHRVRLCDFYANVARVTTPSGAAWGPPLDVPDANDARRCIAIARAVVDAVRARVARRR